MKHDATTISSFRCIAGAGLITAFCFVQLFLILFVSIYANTLTSALVASTASGVASAFMGAIVTSRFEMRSSGALVCVGLYNWGVVSRSQVTKIEAKNGLVITTSSGATVCPPSFAPSLFKLVTGNRHAKRAAARIEAAWELKNTEILPDSVESRTKELRTTFRTKYACLSALVVGCWITLGFTMFSLGAIF